jgi:flagellar biosynthesis chaperone FliJ
MFYFMTNPLTYPLEQLMLIKKNRFDQALKTLEEKKALLEKAHEKLFDLSEERDKALFHKREKLQQLREALDAGTATDKIQQMKVYLKLVDEKLAEKEKKVLDQKKQVDLAQKQVDLATDELFQRKKDLEKLEMHKVEWQKEVKYWAEQKEAIQHDEQGSATYMIQKQDKKRREES